jgi:uridine kinase
MDSITRNELLTIITQSIPLKSNRTLIGIDGPPGSGKTTLANDLTVHLQSQGRNAIRIDVDGFMYPHSVRWSSYTPSNALRTVNHEALFEAVLKPLSYNGNGEYKPAIYDRFSDMSIDAGWTPAPSNAIVIVEGVFMLRNGLERLWDLSIYLDVKTDIFWSRFFQRENGAGALKMPEALKMPICVGHRVYEMESQPKVKASIIINNNDTLSPKLLLKRIEAPKEDLYINYDEALAMVLEQADIEARKADELKELDINVKD